MSAVVDLLAALEEVQCAGPDEVDKPSPASTRGTGQHRDQTGRRQRGCQRVDTSPPWPGLSNGAGNQQVEWDRWRAEVAKRRIEKDAACGAATVTPLPDTDEIDDYLRAEWKRVHVLYSVVDADGVEWHDCPAWELDDLPQPVNVLEQRDVPVYQIREDEQPELLPIERLAEVTLVKRAGKPPKMTDQQIAEALLRIDNGAPVMQVARLIFAQYGFSSAKSCETSLRRRLAERAAAQRAGDWTPPADHPWRQRNKRTWAARQEEVAA